MDELKPCHFRQVDTHGRILCNVIKGGDREVSVQLCRACPVSQINCQNLRAGLEKKTSTPITVRFATGRMEVWDDTPPSIEFKQAACSAKTMPIHSPRDCAGCPIRLPNVIPQSAIQVAHRAKQNAPVAAQNAVTPPVNVEAKAPRGAAGALARAQARAQAEAHAEAQAQMLAQMQAQVQSQAELLAQMRTQVQEELRAGLQAAITQVQPVMQLHAQPQAQAAQTPQRAAGIDLGAAGDLVARAKATAARKAEEKQQRELELAAREKQAQYEAQAQGQPLPEAKSKIIQLQDWLASQVAKKQGGEKRGSNLYKPQAVTPDEDGVSDIVYAPLGMQASAAYQETIDYERCVGWTD